MEIIYKYEKNINYVWVLYFCRFVFIDVWVYLKFLWYINFNKIKDNNIVLLIYLYVWFVNKIKKEEKWNRFLGYVLFFLKKKLVIIINILNELKIWMKKLVKVFKNLMLVICYMCISSVVYM